jgi:hypothetical protein
MSILLLAVCGCASLRRGEEGREHRFTQTTNLAGAKDLLAWGDKAGAARVLLAISEADNLPGVTDEALFRLALLDLRPALERDGNLQSLQLLKRLKKEYTASPWTSQSGQLLELLTGAEELRRQVRSLKSHNQSLNSEVNELNRNIDQLKQLDQELEKKRR